MASGQKISFYDDTFHAWYIEMAAFCIPRLRLFAFYLRIRHEPPFLATPPQVFALRTSCSSISVALAYSINIIYFSRYGALRDFSMADAEASSITLSKPRRL